jgi:hypothetical protein
MSRSFREYDGVRVTKLLNPSRTFSGTEGVTRPPKVGDEAIICHQYHPQDASAAVAVELVDSQGRTIWLADFLPQELEPITPPQNDANVGLSERK